MTRRLLPVRGFAALVMLAAALAGASYAFAADGDPDTTFGGSGTVLLDPPADVADFGSWPNGHPVAADAGAGKTVVAQAWDNPEIGAIGVHRLNADGSLDQSWDKDPEDAERGAADYFARRPRSVEAVRVVDGKTYVVTTWNTTRGNPSVPAFALYRMLPDGTGDPAIPGDGNFDNGARTLGGHAAGDTACEPVSADISSAATITVFFDCGDGVGVMKQFTPDGAPLGQPQDIGAGEGNAIVDAAINEAGHVRVLARGTANDIAHFWLYDRATLIHHGDGSIDALDIAADGSVALAGDALSSAPGWDVRRIDAAGTGIDGFGTKGAAVISDDRLAGAPGAVQHVTLGADGQVTAVGRPASGSGFAVLRVGPSGAPNSGWGPNGVKQFGAADVTVNHVAGPALPLAGGRVLLPSVVDGGSARRAARAEGPQDAPYVQLFRLGTVPNNNQQQNQNQNQQQQQTQQQEQRTTTPPATSTQTSVPSTAPRTARTCLSRRSFAIRLRPKSRRLVSASVTVAGKKAEVERVKGRLTASVDLRKLRQATFTVKITAKDARGRTYREERAYRTCRFGKNGPKVKGGSTVITLGA